MDDDRDDLMKTTYQRTAPDGTKGPVFEVEGSRLTIEEIQAEMAARRQRRGKYSDGTPCCGHAEEG